MNTTKTVSMESQHYGHHKPLPDVPKSIKLLKISVDIEDLKDDYLFARQVKTLVRENQLKQALQMVYDCYHQDYKMVTEIIGKELIQDILSVMEVI